MATEEYQVARVERPMAESEASGSRQQPTCTSKMRSSSSRRASALSLSAASAAAYFSASATIRATSSFELRAVVEVMVTAPLALVTLSTAVTESMPLASRSKVTSTCHDAQCTLSAGRRRPSEMQLNQPIGRSGHRATKQQTVND